METINQKLNQLEIFAGIDTFSLQTVQRPRIANANYFKVVRTQLANGAKPHDRYSLIINPNTYAGHELFSFSEFAYFRERLLFDMGIDDYCIKRIDYRFDCIEDNFDDMFKINRLLVGLFTIRYRIKNSVDSEDLNHIRKSIFARNDGLAIENYNKSIQEPHGIIKNRLELRNKKIRTNQSVRYQAELCIDRLYKAFDCYETWVEQRNNRLLELLSIEESRQRIQSKREFFRKYQDDIYTRSQLTDLFWRTGTSNPQKTADQFQGRYHIEYIKRKSLERYIQILVTALQKYLTS